MSTRVWIGWSGRVGCLWPARSPILKVFNISSFIEGSGYEGTVAGCCMPSGVCPGGMFGGLGQESVGVGWFFGEEQSGVSGSVEVEGGFDAVVSPERKAGCPGRSRQTDSAGPL